jgi:hypothetical protein
MNTVLSRVAKALWKGLIGFLNGFRMVWLAAFYGMVGDVFGFEWWLKEVGKTQEGDGNEC